MNDRTVTFTPQQFAALTAIIDAECVTRNDRITALLQTPAASNISTLHVLQDERAAAESIREAMWAAIVTGDVHTVRGIAIGTPGTEYADGIPYGTTHDYDCPGCAGTSFSASPRSEAYWAS